MELHYLVVSVCSAAAVSYIAKKSLPTYDSIVLLFTNPGEGEKACLKSLCNRTYVYFAKGDDYLFGDATHKIP